MPGCDLRENEVVIGVFSVDINHFAFIIIVNRK